MLNKFLALAFTAFLLAACAAPNRSTHLAEGVSSEGTKSAQVILYSSYCCDGYLNHRCVMNAAYPVGSACFCVGQGNGVVCL